MTIAVDLDGTLAHYDGWKGEEHIGKPVADMLNRVKRWIDSDIKVVIFTSRVSEGGDQAAYSRHIIDKWLTQHGIPGLEITAIKRKEFKEFWDDRAVHVKKNAGRVNTEE